MRCSELPFEPGRLMPSGCYDAVQYLDRTGYGQVGSQPLPLEAHSTLCAQLCAAGASPAAAARAKRLAPPRPRCAGPCHPGAQAHGAARGAGRPEAQRHIPLVPRDGAVRTQGLPRGGLRARLRARRRLAVWDARRLLRVPQDAGRGAGEEGCQGKLPCGCSARSGMRPCSLLAHPIPPPSPSCRNS